MDYCESCGSEHLAPVPCGLTFRERLLSTQVHSSVNESRTAQGRFDREAIDSEFGGTSKERKEDYWASSRGYGNIKHDPKGGAWYKNRKTGNVEHVTDDKLERDFATPK